MTWFCPIVQPTNAKLYNNRAMVNAKLKKLEESADDCTKAIELDENYQKAYLRRFRTYQVEGISLRGGKAERVEDNDRP